MMTEFREVVGSIVILASPLSVDSLASLLQIQQTDIASQLDLLHSVLRNPTDQDAPVRLLHTSFREFLLGPQEGRNLFWIDSKERHDIIAAQCLELLSKRKPLKQDICALEHTRTLRNEVDRGTIDSFITADVQYACSYWVYHLEQSERRICDQDKVQVFLTVHFLHWLEVLGFMGRISDCLNMIDILKSLSAVIFATSHEKCVFSFT